MHLPNVLPRCVSIQISAAPVTRAAAVILLSASSVFLTSCNRAADKAAIQQETERAGALKESVAELKKRDAEIKARLDLMRQQANVTPTLAALKDGQAEVEKRRGELVAIVKGLEDAGRSLRQDIESARKTAAAAR